MSEKNQIKDLKKSQDIILSLYPVQKSYKNYTTFIYLFVFILFILLAL